MAAKKIADLLRETFPPVLHTDWKHAAGQEIDGKDPDVSLAWKNADNLAFSAYHDLSSVKHLKNFQLSPAQRAHETPRQWGNLVPIKVSNAVNANKSALHQLNTGADGILFDIRELSSCAFDELLKEIDWKYCTLSFRIASEAVAEQLLAFISVNYPDEDSIHGTIFSDAPTIARVLQISSQKHLKSAGFYIANSTAVQQVVAALMGAVTYIETFSKPEEQIIATGRVAFSLPANNDFFEIIAMLKTMRLLWHQVGTTYGGLDCFNGLQLHVRAEAWRSTYDPHGNMLRGTFAALAATAAGCNALTVYPEDENNETMARVARNISSVLREESHLDKVADPFAGAYSIEVLTHALAAEAWKQFQTEAAKRLS